MLLSDNAYVISLKSQYHKLRKTRRRLRGAGFERIHPYVVEMPTKEALLEYRVKRAIPYWSTGIASGRLDHPGRVGCLQSHKEVLLQIKEDNQPAFIFEDDILIHKKFDYLFPIAATATQGCPWIYLGCSQFRWRTIDRTTPIYRASLSFGTFAYWVHPSVVDIMLRDIDRWDVPIDTYYACWASQKLVEAKVCYPYLMIAKLGETSTGSRKKGWKSTRKRGWIARHYI
jgi:GR25 family glycosyltransferase involved in LPS biosynthesis